MVLPALIAAAPLFAAAAQATEAGVKGYNSAKDRKEAKKKNKADYLLDLLKQRLESSDSTRRSQNELAGSVANSMQNKASEFRKALLGG